MEKPKNHKAADENPFEIMTESDQADQLTEELTEKSHFYEMLLMFNALFLNSPYAVVILDKEQRIVNISKKFTEIFQYKPHEAKGKYINQLVASPENRAQIDSNIQLIYNGEIIKQEGKRRRKDGKSIYVEIMGYPVINHSLSSGHMLYITIFRKKRLTKDSWNYLRKYCKTILRA